MKAKRFLAWFLSLAMIITMIPNVYASTGTATNGKQLSGDEATVYEELASYIQEIAEGKRASTHIGFGEEVEVLLGGENVKLTADKNLTFTGNSFEEAQGLKVVNALLVDYPYEMYWFNKTTGYEMLAVTGESTLKHLYFEFAVTDDYKGSDDYTVDTEKTTATASALSNANSVIEANANKTDYEKLVAYKDYICDAVSYDNDYANSGEYGNASQMINVFDNDTDTNVVCEGYAKAFQYLCDKTEWSGEVQCYTITGNMTGGTGEGPHMWNIVTLEGKNYLVDITNSDTGTAGESGALFLAGGTPSGNTYTINDVSFTHVIRLCGAAM